MTGKQLKQMSDLAFAAWVLQERHDRMSNPNTPLAAKLGNSVLRAVADLNAAIRKGVL